MKREVDRSLIEQLQRQIQTLQGGRQNKTDGLKGLGLGSIESVFPDGVFPLGLTHELLSDSAEEASCTNAFISVILARLMEKGRPCLWISNQRKIFPPALKNFGIEPDRIFFVDVFKPKEALWVLEEALKCGALGSVVAEMRELSFSDSQRLQLAVERSKVTGFIHRHQPLTLGPVTCVTRWRIKPAPSYVPGQLPGFGYPRWRVQLLKVRQALPTEWLLQWSPEGLETILPEVVPATKIIQLQTA